jgi:hypothetical protein
MLSSTIPKRSWSVPQTIHPRGLDGAFNDLFDDRALLFRAHVPLRFLLPAGLVG